MANARGVRVLRLAYDGPTPVKKRVRAGGQSLLRLDSGTRPGTVHDLSGPALVEERETTVVLPPGWEAVVDEIGCITASRRS